MQNKYCICTMHFSASDNPDLSKGLGPTCSGWGERVRPSGGQSPEVEWGSNLSEYHALSVAFIAVSLVWTIENVHEIC